MVLMYPRTVKVRSSSGTVNEYVRVVEAYREGVKVKQRVVAGWLETDFVCDRKGRRFIPHWHQRRRVRVHPRQLDAWYRTLDQLHAAKDRIEVALYHRLRDLFSLKPDLVLYDITSTYFEGAGPHDFAVRTGNVDRKSTRLNSSHLVISYAVFCLKKKISSYVPLES